MKPEQPLAQAIAELREKRTQYEAVSHVSYMLPEHRNYQAACITLAPRLVDEVERLKSTYEPDCYCVCHSPISSCPSCDHCKGINAVSDALLKVELSRLQKGIEAVANELADRSTELWTAYKTGDYPMRGNAHVEGMSDAFSEAATKVKAALAAGED